VQLYLGHAAAAAAAIETAEKVLAKAGAGSINKAFTKIAIEQLIAEGKLSRTDTLGKFFPDYPQSATRAATIEQLLTHRAGVAGFFGAQFNTAPKHQFVSNADYVEFVGGLPAAFSPGERNQYCNGCYITLGAIVHNVSGMPYEKYVAERIFARAEMTSTGYPRSDQQASDIALGYTRRGGDGTLRSNVAMHGVTGSAAGGGYSTALDLLTFVKAVKAGKLPGEGGIGIAGGRRGRMRWWSRVGSGRWWCWRILTRRRGSRSALRVRVRWHLRSAK
jgi:CubicO group peptidase (beta-lactamase class C family)